MAEFTNLNKEAVRNAYRRFQSHQKDMIEANDDFFE